MVRRLVCSSSGRATMLLIMSCVGLVFVTTFTDAAPAILSQNQTPVTLLSRLTQLFVTVSADGLVQANGLSSRDSDANLIMEHVESLRRYRIRRRDSNIYLSVTPAGELKALAEGTVNGSSSHFRLTESFIEGQYYIKLQTRVEYQPSGGSSDTTTGTPPSQNATCYIAINDIFTGEPPCNVCDVPGNDFTFDEDALLFQRDLHN